jgi:hypothetical protein
MAKITLFQVFIIETYPKGMRKNCDLAIFVDIAAAMKDGIQFRVSSNKVILSQGIDGLIPSKYFSHVLSMPDLKPIDVDFPKTLSKEETK